MEVTGETRVRVRLWYLNSTVTPTITNDSEHTESVCGVNGASTQKPLESV
jgi:hypothetical protein